MTTWFIVTPRYMLYGPTHLDPPEYGSDVVEVSADTKRQALVKGVRELRRIGSHWLQDMTSDGRSPFTGLQAHLDRRYYEGTD